MDQFIVRNPQASFLKRSLELESPENNKRKRIEDDIVNNSPPSTNSSPALTPRSTSPPMSPNFNVTPVKIQNAPEDLSSKLKRIQNSMDWFDDEVINTCFELFSLQFPKVGFLSSFTFAHANSHTWSATKNTMQKFEQGHITQVLIPRHVGNHWVLILLQRSMDDYTVALLDPLGEETTQPQEVKEWLQALPSQHAWQFLIPFSMSTHQKDGYSCGPFVCRYAELLSTGKTFDQIDMDCSNINIKQYRSLLLQHVMKNLHRVKINKPTPEKNANGISTTDANQNSRPQQVLA